MLENNSWTVAQFSSPAEVKWKPRYPTSHALRAARQDRSLLNAGTQGREYVGEQQANQLLSVRCGPIMKGQEQKIAAGGSSIHRTHL